MKRKLCLNTIRTNATALIFLLLSFIPQTSSAQVDQKDSLFLVAMYIAYDGENWTHNDNWLSGTVDSWYGITLNADGTRVSKIELPENNITASFPRTLDDRNWIISFFADLIFNDFQKLSDLIDIIDVIYSLPGISFGELTDINLSRNNISGNIPIEINDSKNLKTINLSYNKFSGNIPEQIGDLGQLESLDLRNNQFSGPIPDKLFNAKKLQRIYLQNNQLSGNIPSTIDQLSALKRIYLENNQLSGIPPEQLWNLSQLEQLSLRTNSFSGQLSDKVGQLTQLTKLDLSENQFEGTIPGTIGNLSKLSELLLHVNQFTGDLPASIGTIPNLMNLNIHTNLLVNLPELPNVWNDFKCYNNYFTFEDFEKNLELQRKVNRYDIVPQYRFGEEQEYTRIVKTNFWIASPCGGQYNNYTWRQNEAYRSGPVKSDTLKFLPLEWTDTGEYYVEATNDSVPDLVIKSKIIIINLENNCLYEDSLRLVEFYHATNGPNWTNKENWLTGPVHSWYGIILTNDGCNVSKIELPTNNLSGNLPAIIGDFMELNSIVLSENNLIGAIPPELYNLTQLSNLELQYNQLNGNISDEISRLEQLVNLNLMENDLSGNIPAGLYQCANIESIQLGYNSLTGTIPNEIANLNKLQTYSLTHNQMGGTIPPGLYTLSNMISIDLSANNFYGTIDPNIGNLTQLELLQLSQNQFEGTIPNTISQLSELTLLRINSNRFESALPAEIASLAKLEELYFDNNLFTDIPNLSNVLSTTWCAMNHLTFEDFERNLDEINSATKTFNYVPQLRFERDTTIYITEGNPLILTRFCGGTANHYTWYFDGTTITNDNPNLEFQSVKFSDAGDYWVTVSSDLVPDLILESERIHLVVNEHCIQTDSLALVDLFNTTGGNNWINNSNWLTGPLNTWFGIEQLSNDGCKVTEIDLSSNGLDGELTESVGQLQELRKFVLANNRLRYLLPNSISSLGHLTEFDISGNYFLFGDIDAAGIGQKQTNYIYAPQDTILALEELYEQRSIAIIDDFFEGNIYEWFHNNQPFGTNENTIEISQTGAYYCLVTNPAYPGLTLYSDTLIIDLILPHNEDVEPVNLVIIDGIHPPQFFVKNIELYPENHLLVFNRWGNKIFESKSYNNELNFNNYAAGTYYYVLNYTKPEGTAQIKSFVEVIKE